MTESAAVAPAIELEDVHKSYRIYHKRHTTLKEAVLRRRRAEFEVRPVLDGVNLTVPHGQSLGIIGRNGAGKSTTLKLVAGLISPDAGRVTVRGRVSTLLELGAGFQGDYTGEENIYLYGALMGLSNRYIKERFAEIVDFSGMGKQIDNMVKTYSSGQYMRLAFAVAVNVDPEVLIIDEVIAVGDEEFQRKCFERTADLRRRGKTIVIVSHDLTSIQRFCDRAIWIENGRIAADGAPADVVREYLGTMGEAAPEPGGGAPVKITNLSVADARGEVVDAIRAGEAVTIRFTLDSGMPLTGVQAQLRLLNGDGVVVVSSATDPREPLAIRAGGEALSCSLAALPLAAGKYRVEVGLMNTDTGIMAHPPHEPLLLTVVGEANEGVVAVTSSWATLAARGDRSNRA